MFSAVLYAYGGVIVRTLTPFPTPPIGSNLSNINIPFRESYDGEQCITSKTRVSSEATIYHIESLLIELQLCVLFFLRRFHKNKIAKRDCRFVMSASQHGTARLN